MKNYYSIGIDTFRFVIPKDSLEVFLRKKDLYAKIRKSTRNIQIHEYVSQKFKSQKTSHPKYPFDVKYINLKRGNKSLSNTILLISNSISCHQVSKNNKKGYEHYAEVVFAGLHQPSKDIDPLSLKTLKSFLKRFKVHSIDLAVDFDWEHKVNNTNKKIVFEAIKSYIEGEGNIRNEGSSLYVNNTTSINGLTKILLYDKFKKQTEYHKEPIRDELKNWKRLELTLKIKNRFFHWIEEDGANEGIDMLNDITLKMGVRNIIGLNVDTLSKQIRKLKDLRLAIDFKAWAKAPPDKSNQRSKNEFSKK